VFVPTPADENKRLFVLDQNGAVPTICSGVHARLNTAVGVFEDVILTTPVTTAGMSGAALVDSDSRLWGFLLGTFATFSFYMPANLLLTQERSRLA
jgi:S1-C subfamily serine protease